MAGKEVEIAGQIVNVNKNMGKVLEQARDRALMVQATHAADETTAAVHVRQRVNNAYDLADGVRNNAVMLSNQITQSARGNPGLETSLRMNLEEPLMLGASYLITRYLTRPL
jgi:hypothetical protein